MLTAEYYQIGRQKIKQQLRNAQLIARYLDDNLTHDEKLEFDAWLNQSSKNQKLLESFRQRIKLSEKIDAYEKVNIDSALEGIQQKRDNIQKPTYNLRKWYKYAAVFALFLCASTLYITFFTSNPADRAKKLEETLIIENEIITLQMEDGSIKTIDPNQIQQIQNVKGQQIGNQTNGKLTYNSNSELKELVFNTLNVPYGKKLKLELSDGTLVHLNSGTSLKYPVHFIKGQNREVFIDGEAYFEVAPDKAHPFKVYVKDVQVEVLGTKFNVSSYPEQNNINTVLVEGSVKMHYSQDGQEVTTNLVPGQLAKWNKGDKKMAINNVNANDYIGWVDGQFIFRNTSFDNILHKLERNYNVSFKSQYPEIMKRRFSSSFQEDEIEKIIEVFASYMEFDYTILNNKIIIQKP